MMQTTSCRLCGDTLYRAAVMWDEWGYVDGRGNRLGTDSDLRHLPDGAYARLSELAERCTTSAGKSDMSVEGERAIREYGRLKTRMEFGSSFHTHRAMEHLRVPNCGQEPVPYGCGMPAYLRPSGWQCRVHLVPLEQCVPSRTERFSAEPPLRECDTGHMPRG